MRTSCAIQTTALAHAAFHKPRKHQRC